MKNKELIKEFTRWVELGKPAIWVKYEKDDNYWDWLEEPCWNCTDSTYYIVEDKHAELRKLQIDKPNTKFQRKHIRSSIWVDVEDKKDLWDLFYDYRVKQKEWYEDLDMIDKPVWVRDFIDEDWEMDVFVDYCYSAKDKFVCQRGIWKYAKPVKPEDCYQGTENEN